MSSRNRWHPSHEPATLPQRAPRTVDTIAARNRAMRDLAGVLPLRPRYLDRTGKPIGGGA